MEPGQTARAILFHCYQRQLHHKRIGVTELADILETTKPNISQLIKHLSDVGYLDRKPYQPIAFTSNGLLKAEQLYQRILILESYLFKTLAMPFFQCRAEAFSWELGIFDATLAAIYEKTNIEIGLVGDTFPQKEQKPITCRLLKAAMDKEMLMVVAIRNLDSIDRAFLPELAALYLEELIITNHIQETNTLVIVSQGKKFLLPVTVAANILVRESF
jgi:Mn-dependent DtxR family transcriptional regulator